MSRASRAPRLKKVVAEKRKGSMPIAAVPSFSPGRVQAGRAPAQPVVPHVACGPCRIARCREAAIRRSQQVNSRRG
eukprot:COSAG01_NODE_228_length_21104_cov_210.303832_12_plen_76_part_00